MQLFGVSFRVSFRVSFMCQQERKEAKQSGKIKQALNENGLVNQRFTRPFVPKIGFAIFWTKISYK
jgi:hypothetical protein